MFEGQVTTPTRGQVKTNAPRWLFVGVVVLLAGNILACMVFSNLFTGATIDHVVSGGPPPVEALSAQLSGPRSLQADVDAVKPERVQEIEAMIRGDVAMRSLDLVEKLALAESRRTDSTHEEWIAQVSEGRRFRENVLMLVEIVIVVLIVIVPLAVMGFAGREVGDWLERVLTHRAEIRARVLEAQAEMDEQAFKTAHLGRPR